MIHYLIGSMLYVCIYNQHVDLLEGDLILLHKCVVTQPSQWIPGLQRIAVVQEAVCLAEGLKNSGRLMTFTLKIKCPKTSEVSPEVALFEKQDMLNGILPAFKLMSRLHTLELTVSELKISLRRSGFILQREKSCLDPIFGWTSSSVAFFKTLSS